MPPLSIKSPHPRMLAEVQNLESKIVIPEPVIPWDEDLEVQENVSLQVEEASGKEDHSKVTESEVPISKGGSTTCESGVQKQTPEEKKWNQIHTDWSDYPYNMVRLCAFRRDAVSLSSGNSYQ